MAVFAAYLAGKLFDENGEPLNPQGASRAGRRYRYYVSRALVRGSAEQRQGGWRVPAPEIERSALAAARVILDDKPAILAAVQASAINPTDIKRILAIVSDWTGRLMSETEAAGAVMEVVERVQLTEDSIRVTLGIPIPCSRNVDEANASILRVSRFAPTKMKRRGLELRIILNRKDELPRKVDTTLLKGIARARRWFEEVASGRIPSLAEVARRERLAKRYVARLTRLAFIAPAIVDAVVEGLVPAGLNLQMLMDSRIKLPMGWAEQERALEFEA